MTNNQHISQLLEKFGNGQASQDEIRELFALVRETADDEALVAHMQAQMEQSDPGSAEDQEYWKDRLKGLSQRITGNVNPVADRVPARPLVRIGRKSFLRYAAAILIVVGLGAVAIVYQRYNQQKKNGTLAAHPAAGDIAPGGERATLTLSDGTVIALDSMANGTIAQQGNAAVVKSSNGQLAYNTKGLPAAGRMLNKMATPKGGQYRLTLPDGTKVWLNAASSITYPVAFVGDKRDVKTSGEVYFEVARDKEKPFIVDAGGRTAIEVLGTNFNVNGYADDGSIKTTLLEGSVKVTGNTFVVLKPGQQAVVEDPDQAQVAQAKAAQAKVADQKTILVRTVNTDQVMAWKNGFFNLQDARFEEVMKQLERWYDIEVKYEGKAPSIGFQGKMDRGVHLSGVLRLLSELGVQCRLEGRTLIVHGN